MFTHRDQQLVDFVRGRLGCRCPDDVFRSIAIEPECDADGSPLFTRVAVGDRLLIYLAHPRTGREPSELAAALARIGRAERDRRGFNRFRLVFPADDVAAIEDAVGQCFAGAVGPDDRAHLHILPESELPVPARRVTGTDRAVRGR